MSVDPTLAHFLNWADFEGHTFMGRCLRRELTDTSAPRWTYTFNDVVSLNVSGLNSYVWRGGVVFKEEENVVLMGDLWLLREQMCVAFTVGKEAMLNGGTIRRRDLDISKISESEFRLLRAALLPKP